MGIEANSLFDSMQMIAKKVLESSKFDRTVQAIISSCVDSAKGKPAMQSSLQGKVKDR